MRVVTKDEVFQSKEAFLRDIKSGSVFIYPTDTIYGLGCNAIVDKGVQKVREIKSRHKRPFSIIAPSVQWIRDNCIITEQAEEWLKKLPGPYTLILPLKEDSKGLISSYVNEGSPDTIGVRIPDHWISTLVAELGYPIITTSANHVGEDFMTSLDDLASDIKQNISFVIYEGPIEGHPSNLVNLATPELEVTQR